VTDESGAIVPGAKIILSGAAGLSKTAMAMDDGSYTFADLPQGSYTVQASAPSLFLRQPGKISLRRACRRLISF
jgi:Carboxypeptidase regulatory-like domain